MKRSALWPVLLYFFLAFVLLGYTRALLRDENDSLTSIVATALSGSLMVVAAVLLADVFPYMEPFPKIPILYNALWKALLYTQMVFVLELLKEFVPLLWRGGDLTAAHDRVLSLRFLIVQVWLGVLMANFW